jgi:peptide/nickel transport system substrate-binding protein
VLFKKPTPFWADAFVGYGGMILPRHLFEPYKGVNSLRWRPIVVG